MPTPSDVPNRRARSRPEDEWHLSRHALLRAAELGYTEEEVLECAQHPGTRYETDPKKYGPGNFMCKRGDIAIVTVDRDKLVRTVLLPRTDDWQHGKDRR